MDKLYDIAEFVGEHSMYIVAFFIGVLVMLIIWMLRCPEYFFEVEEYDDEEQAIEIEECDHSCGSH